MLGIPDTAYISLALETRCCKQVPARKFCNLIGWHGYFKLELVAFHNSTNLFERTTALYTTICTAASYELSLHYVLTESTISDL